MQEVSLNLFSVKTKPQKLILYEIIKTTPETKNRNMRYSLAAKVAKRASKDGPVFSVGNQIYASQEIPTKYNELLDIEEIKVPFEIEIEKKDELSLTDISHGTEMLVNKLVDWYHKEKIPNSFHMENVNYQGQNIFARLESILYKTYPINLNEGILRATRTFNGIPYLLLDIDYRKTWEQTLWDNVKYFVKYVLNENIYLPNIQTIQAVNEKFGRTGSKRGNFVQGKNQVGEYEVIEFDFSKTPDTPSTAGQKSQREYFSSVYGNEGKIKDEKQPLVKVRNLKGYYYGNENYHVPELLEFGRIPPHLKENKRLMSAIINIEKPAPRGRYSQILSFVQGDPFSKSKGFAEDEFIKSFVDISIEPIKVPAKILPFIKIKMSDSIFSVSSDSDFLGSIWKKKFHRIPIVNKVNILYKKERESDVLHFYSLLQQSSAERGMILPDSESIIVNGEKVDDYIKSLDKNIDADVVISFMPLDEEEIYSKLKEELLIKYGILHQNISYEKTLDVIAEYERRRNEKGIKSITTLVAMQLCAKLGGAPWAFSEPIYDKNYPILGLDVYHDENSIIGGCAVFDPYGEYLFSDAKITDLRDLLSSVLRTYAERFGKPEGLMIFRDGLNFTQEQDYLYSPNGEIEIINNVLSDFGFSNLVLVMEKKNTHLRMYKQIDKYKVDNPNPGTVLMGYPFEENEMLMISQETYQGTVSPVFYKVIQPTNPDMEKIANAVNKLCRHHWNTNRAIKIPAPALHADKITYIIRRKLGGSLPNPDVLNKPFYL